jgi:apolipoprotein N-acyltransferase
MGEYLPLTRLHCLAAKYGLHTFYKPGKHQIKFATNKANILPTVCYEECFGHFFRNQVKQEVDLVVNLTNDAWFLPSKFSNEHLFLAQFRAVENGRWIARSCNTGVTCTIDPCGKIVDQLPVYDAHQKLYQGALVTEIPVYKLTTLYYQYGEFFVRIVALLSLVEILRKSLTRKLFIPLVNEKTSL